MGRSATFAELISAGHLELGDGYRTKRSEYGVPGVPILRVADIADGTIEPGSTDYVSDDYRPSMGTKISRPSDIVLTTKGTVGRVAIMPNDGLEFVYSPQVCYFRPNPEVLSPRYLYYWFRSDLFWSQARSMKGQTDMADYINLTDIRALRIAIPDRLKQEAIAEVLGALDDKIAINDRIAQTTYRLAIAQSRVAVSKWDGRESPLTDFAEIVKGASYRSSDLVFGSDWLVTLKCVGRDGLFQSAGLKPYAGDNKPGQVVDHGDVVVAQTDLTQRADVIGRPVRVERGNVLGRLVASLDLAVVKPRDGMSREVLLGLLSGREFLNHALGYCNGTTVLHLGSRALPEFRFARPDARSVERLTSLMVPLLGRSDRAREENHALVRLRDALLPKLMSGEIRVRDAEKAVEDAL